MRDSKSDSGTRDIRYTDPFSAEAVGLAQKFITSVAERQALENEIKQLSEQGFVILPNQIDGAVLESMRDALDRINDQTPNGRVEFEGYQTHRAYGVVCKTEVFDELIMNRAVLAIIEGYFDETPQLSASMGMTLYQGQKAQPLHRDTGHYRLPWPRPPLEVNAIWAFDDFHEDNGATRYIRGSHLNPTETRPSEKPMIAQMPAGSVLIYDGALWHGAGGSVAEGARRRCINNIYARQWLRQQDNVYLSLTPERVLKSGTIMQRLLGYWVYGSTLGVVDGEPPISMLKRAYVSKVNRD